MRYRTLGVCSEAGAPGTPSHASARLLILFPHDISSRHRMAWRLPVVNHSQPSPPPRSSPGPFTLEHDFLVYHHVSYTSCRSIASRSCLLLLQISESSYGVSFTRCVIHFPQAFSFLTPWCHLLLQVSISRVTGSGASSPSLHAVVACSSPSSVFTRQ